MTLNELNDFIQHLLGWDNTHPYVFAVHDKHYAYLGLDLLPQMTVGSFQSPVFNQ